MLLGTETNLIYEVNINFVNKPKNLKIYLDENMKQEINIENNILDFKKFLTYNDAKNIQHQPFYWNWPLESGETQAEIDSNDIEDTKSMNEIMSMDIAVTGTQTNSNGGNIIYNGNGATVGGMFSSVLNADNSTILTANNYQRKYIVNLDANGGNVNTSKLVDEYEFSHWSTDNRNQNVLFFSANEKYNTAREFLQYTDIAPYIDQYGLGRYYLNLDIKSTDTTIQNQIQVYCQNGNSSKYSIGNLMVDVDTEYKNKKLNVSVINQRLTEQLAMLAFYGIYGTGNYPCVKNVTFDVGNGYENEEIVTNSNFSEGSINLYAKWKPKSVILPIPVKEGYTFLGWYTEKDGGTKVDNTYIPTEDITLYAHWD